MRREALYAQRWHTTRVLRAYFWRVAIAFEKGNTAVAKGEFALINEADESVLSWISKTAESAAVLVALNRSAAAQTASYGLASRAGHGPQATTLLSSFLKPDESADLTKLALPPYGAFVRNVEIALRRHGRTKQPQADERGFLKTVTGIGRD